MNLNEQFKDAWALSDVEMEGIEVLFHVYEYGNYEGEAYSLFRKGNVLYQSYGSHCSCYGLEGQFGEEEVTTEEVLFKLNNGKFYVDVEGLREIVEKLV